MLGESINKPQFSSCRFNPHLFPKPKNIESYQEGFYVKERQGDER